MVRLNNLPHFSHFLHCLLNCKKKTKHSINHVVHIEFQASLDPVMALAQAECGGYRAAEFMTNAVQGLSAV